MIHATNNAVAFYESMGFIRVGAIVQASSENNDEDSESQLPDMKNIVRSPFTTYFTKKNGEILFDVAKAFDVNVWDLIFLNHYMYPSLEPKSFLVKKTKLLIPKRDARSKNELNLDGNVNWHVAKEDETPKSIALKLKIPCHKLVEANRARLPDLCPSSRLKKG